MRSVENEKNSAINNPLKKDSSALSIINLKNVQFSFSHSRFSAIHVECGKRDVCNLENFFQSDHPQQQAHGTKVCPHLCISSWPCQQ